MTDGKLARAIDTQSVANVLREHADQADRDGQLSGAAIDAMSVGGLFRAGVPIKFGGNEVDPATALTTFAEVGAACASSAWVLFSNYMAQRWVGTFDEEVHQELWASGPDVPMCMVTNGVGVTAEAVPGGLRISGRWPWASGCHFAQWAAVNGVPLPHGSGRGVAVVPVTDLGIDSSWDMLGLRATASDTLVADNIFVPDHRIRPFADVWNGGGDGALYRMPAGGVAVVLVSPILGAAREIYARTLQALGSGKKLAMSFYPGLADAPSVQATLAEAAAKIDAAEAMVLRSAHDLYDVIVTGSEPAIVQRAHQRVLAASAVAGLVDAAGLLMNVNGASAFANSNSLQRPWRDLQTGSRHPLFNLALWREVYGRLLVGVTDPITTIL